MQHPTLANLNPDQRPENSPPTSSLIKPTQANYTPPRQLTTDH
jgi:hypothetical protein